MNNEIKEILDYFRKYATIRENTMISEIEDCITNLKKKYENAVVDYEMEKAKNNIIVKLGDEYSSTIDELVKHCLNQKTKIKELEQKYDKALTDLVKESHRRMELEEESERLKENAIHNDKVVDQARWNEMLYKGRIDKAIPMLKELNIKIKEILRIGIDIKEIGDIENILNGVMNNEKI